MEPIIPLASRAQDVFAFLESKGYEVYFPNQKFGECTSPYVVIRTETTSQFMEYSSTQTFYGILCYIPKNHYSTLDPFVDGVVETLKGIRPMLKPTYNRTAPFFDETVQGWMVSLEYVNYRKI